MAALGPTAVPVPRVLALCDDPDVVGAPFYAMAEVEGVVYREPGQTAELTAAQRRALAEELVDVLARIHEVDLEATGLRDFGRPDGYVERRCGAGPPSGRPAAPATSRACPSSSTRSADSAP